MASATSAWFKRYSLILYFIFAYAFSWAVWIPLILSARGILAWELPYSLYYLGSFGPMASALILTALVNGRAGLAKLLGRVFKWRVSFRYYAFAVLVPVALFILALILQRILRNTWPDLRLLGQADYLPRLGIPGVLLLWFLTYGLGEETGWRGFALPRMQQSRPAANAGLLLGILWACWHLPAFLFRDTYVGMGLIGFPMFFVSIAFASVVFTWLYNSTAGSLLLVILFHIFFNWLSVSEAGGEFSAIIMSAPLVLWAIFVVRKYGPENAAPIAKQLPD